MKEQATVQMTKPNREHIKQHLEFIFNGLEKDFPKGMIEISVLNNSEYFPITDIDAAANRAYELNEQGKNVYTTAALLVPDVIEKVEARKLLEKKKVARARAEDFMACQVTWVDIDNLPATDKDDLKQQYKDAPPNYYVVTSRTDTEINTHLYWLLDEAITDKAKLEEINKGIIEKLKGDKGTHNCTRLMRIGGSVAWPSKEGRVVQIVENNNTDYFPPHDIDNLSRTYPLSAPTPLLSIKKSSLNLQDNEKFSEEDVIDMLCYISPDNEYADWISIGMAIKDHGLPFHVWDNWSSKGSKYPGSIELQKKWNSFNGSGTSIGTVYYLADRAGWKPKQSHALSSKALSQKIEKSNTEKVNPETGEIVEERPPRTITYELAKDIQPNLDVNDFVQDILGEEQFSVVYGESNCGKTFFISDLCFHVAHGTEYCGKRVEQGAVVYVSLEGARGFKQRIHAHRIHNMILDKDMPMAVIGSQIDFLNPEGNIAEFIEVLEEIAEKIGKIKLIVVDTLARAISGGDENSGQDMGMLVKHADTIKEYVGAHICFVHHSGKNRALGSRGHSSLRAAVDTEIEIHREEDAEHSTIKFVKQREMEMIDDMFFKIKPVVLGMNKYEEEVTSCVVQHIDKPEERIKDAGLNPHEKFVYDVILNTLINCGKDYNIKDGGTVKAIDYIELADGLEAAGYRSFANIEDQHDKVVAATNIVRMALRKKGYINYNNVRIWALNHAEDL